MPFGDNQRYDFVIDRGNGFERIQVKTGRLRNGSIQFNACSSQAHRGKGRKAYQGDIEFFAVFCPDTYTSYLVPVGTLKRLGTLRVERAKNNQTKNLILAKDYEI